MTYTSMWQKWKFNYFSLFFNFDINFYLSIFLISITLYQHFNNLYNSLLLMGPVFEFLIYLCLSIQSKSFQLANLICQNKIHEIGLMYKLCNTWKNIKMCINATILTCNLESPSRTPKEPLSGPLLSRQTVYKSSSFSGTDQIRQSL